jgi:hypothetical protein
LHSQTRQDIESIILGIKEELQYEALCLIKPAIKDSIDYGRKPLKEVSSTLPGSVERSKSIDTPGFDRPSSNSRNDFTVELKEFTLGQKEPDSSNRSQGSYR